MDCPRCGMRHIWVEAYWAYCSYCDSEFERRKTMVKWVDTDPLIVGDIDIFDIWDEEIG